MRESLYEHAGGDVALHRLEELFYDKALADPLLRQLFSERVPTHVDHLTWFTAESFGGPDRFTASLGFEHIIDVHRHLDITDEERERFVALYLESANRTENRKSGTTRPLPGHVRTRGARGLRSVDEDEREQAVGGPNGQEVERDRKRGDDELAKRDGQHDEAETEHEEEDVWGRVGDRVEVVDGLGCLAPT